MKRWVLGIFLAALTITSGARLMGRETPVSSRATTPGISHLDDYARSLEYGHRTTGLR